MNVAPQERLALAEEKFFFLKKNTVCKNTLRFEKDLFLTLIKTHTFYTLSASRMPRVYALGAYAL